MEVEFWVMNSVQTNFVGHALEIRYVTPEILGISVGRAQPLKVSLYTKWARLS